MRLADVLETVPACETVSIQDGTGLLFLGNCMDFRVRATHDKLYRLLLRKVDTIRAGVPDTCVVILLDDKEE